MRTSDKVHELFLNYACNAKCPFCYNPPLTPELLKSDLSFDQACRSLYAGARSGARQLNLHGGEVTLRDDLPKLLGLARKLGFAQITVVTNGVRLAQPAYARRLAACGATHFRLSIHGDTAGLHDGILAIPGAFEKCLKALSHLRRLGIPAGLNYVLIRSNAAALPGFLQRFCLDDGVDDVIVYFPHLRGMMALNAPEAGLTYAQAAPHARAGAELLERAGRLESLLLANFAPCVLPEFAHRMIDWAEGAASGSAMTHPEGFTEDIAEMKHGQKTRVGVCRSCVLRSRCLGVDREYAERYGSAGLTALRSEPAPEAVRC